MFLDRDGTLNRDPGYLSDVSQVELLQNVGAGLKQIQQLGFEIVIISNQSGVGRGLIQLSGLKQIENKLTQLLASDGVRAPLGFFCCIHHPAEDCHCRKPSDFWIREASRRLDIDLSQSFMVGDRETDLHTGRSAGVKGVALVLTGDGVKTQSAGFGNDADFVGKDLLAVAEWIASFTLGR